MSDTVDRLIAELEKEICERLRENADEYIRGAITAGTCSDKYESYADAALSEAKPIWYASAGRVQRTTGHE